MSISSTTKKQDNKDQYYIIRCDRSGVFFGKIGKREGQEAQILDARCVFYWAKAATIMELSQTGDKSSSNSKITVEVPEITVTDVIQIVPCTDEAVSVFKSTPEWRA